MKADLRFRNLHQQQEDGQQQADEQIGEVLSDYVNEEEVQEDISEHVQKDSDHIFEQEKIYEDLPANLGEIRQQTKYVLREKPRKNTLFL